MSPAPTECRTPPPSLPFPIRIPLPYPPPPSSSPTECRPSAGVRKAALQGVNGLGWRATRPAHAGLLAPRGSARAGGAGTGPGVRGGHAACPLSTRGGTRLVRLVRGGGGGGRRCLVTELALVGVDEESERPAHLHAPAAAPRRAVRSSARRHLRPWPAARTSTGVCEHFVKFVEGRGEGGHPLAVGRERSVSPAESASTAAPLPCVRARPAARVIPPPPPPPPPPPACPISTG